ncbi:hypothetical protein MYBA111488_10525 [Mycobacterium basiliense]
MEQTLPHRHPGFGVASVGGETTSRRPRVRICCRFPCVNPGPGFLRGAALVWLVAQIACVGRPAARR